MPQLNWLPSEELWLDSIAERLFDGQLLVLRSLPRWGVSSACRAISDRLGHSAVLVDGKNFDEATQADARLALDRHVASILENQGLAQLVFDNYGSAIRRSQGGSLHSVLNRLLVDGPSARDIGALLTARSSDLLDVGFAGSPLISRATTVTPPILTKDDAEAIGISFDQLRRSVGELTWLARRFNGVSLRDGRVAAAEQLANDRRRIVESLPLAALTVLSGALAFADADPVSQDALLALGMVEVGGEFSFSELAIKAGVREATQLLTPGWPGTREESVRRFAGLVAGADDAIWIDRYVFARLELVRPFLEDVRELTPAKIRILTSWDRDRPQLGTEIANTLSDLANVAVRFMHRGDRVRLHDRHLILPGLRSGFTLPTAGVILAQDDPGSSVSLRMPNLAFDYAECWARGERIVSN